MTSLGQKARDNWSVLFAVAVAVFLLLSNTNVSKLVPTISWRDTPSATAEPATSEAPSSGSTSAGRETATTSAPISAGTFSFSVEAFRVTQNDDGAYEARVTLDVTNEGDGLARFNPELIRLARTGSGVSPSNDKLFVMDVSPHLSQLISLTFNVSPAPGASYKLTYNGSTIYSGIPR